MGVAVGRFDDARDKDMRMRFSLGFKGTSIEAEF